MASSRLVNACTALLVAAEAGTQADAQEAGADELRTGPRLGTGLAALVHALCATSVVLVVTWFGALDSGFAWGSGDAGVFAWHPTLMTLGLLAFFSEAALAFRLGLGKRLHAALHAAALACVVMGLVAVLRFHNEASPPIPNLYSLHSWLGLLAVGAYGANFLLGSAAFGLQLPAQATRARLVPVHAAAGRLVLSVLVAASVCTGVLEKLTFGKDCNDASGHRNAKCNVGSALALVAVALVLLVAVLLAMPRRPATPSSSRRPPL